MCDLPDGISEHRTTDTRSILAILGNYNLLALSDGWAVCSCCRSLTWKKDCSYNAKRKHRSWEAFDEKKDLLMSHVATTVNY